MILDIFDSKQISIDGKFIDSYKKLKLEQTINDHHKFTLHLDSGVSDKLNTDAINEAKEWLGKTIVISTTGKDFVGVVTDISFEDSYNEDKYIVVKGFSPTILLEDGNKSQSWLGKTLADIFKALTNNGRLNVKITPEYTSSIEYEAQYTESNFHFIQRLCKQYYEWMFYDGETLMLGKPEKPEAKQLLIGIDISKIKTHITTEARKSKSTSFSSLNNNTYSAQSPDNVSGLNDLGDFAFKTSLQIYPEGHNEFPLARIPDQSTLDKLMKRRQQSIASQTHYIEVTSTCKGLTIGSVIEIASADPLKRDNIETKGKYIITEIKHEVDFDKYYQNEFKALPAEIAVLPEPEVEMPIAQVQMATVVSNDDPKKKGRDSVSSNRGMVFIPEKGDQVLVGFRHNNPNRPFVLGSLFNGKSGGGGGSDNKTKSITTRSGNTVSLNDADKSITISDPSGSQVLLDGKENILMSSKTSINLTVGSSSITINKEGKITIEGVEIEVKSSGSISNTSSKVTISGAEEVAINGKNSTNINGASVNVSGNATTNVSSSGTTVIDGTIVKIN